MSIRPAGRLLALAAMAAGAAKLALFVGDPDVAGVEVSGGSYARAAATVWTVRTDTLGNTYPIVFPKPSATWGAVTHFQVLDASNAPLWSGQLNRAITLDATTPALVLGAGTALVRIP